MSGQIVELEDGRTYSVHFFDNGTAPRVVRINCGAGRGAHRLVPIGSPLRERVIAAACAFPHPKLQRVTVAEVVAQMVAVD